jgi:hypothetical protein
MTIGAALRRTLRGPLRTRIRATQARGGVLGGRRRAGPPDYVGIGVQRCGTSWWQSLIEQHPGVDALGMGVKELHFFDSAWARDLTEADTARYATHFRRSPGQLIGEWTPRYLYDPWAVPALLHAAPSARLLVLLRDPVARFRSGIRHAQKRMGTVNADAVTDAFGRGCYAPQLTRLLELVPRSQVLLLQFERCLLDPEARLAETFEFLGLPPARVRNPGATNVSGSSVAIAGSLIDEVRDRYRSDAVSVAAMFPDEIDLHLWRDLNTDQ